MTLDWTMDEYDANGGDAAMTGKLADNLGVDPSTITIISVTPGSVVIDYKVELPDGTDPDDFAK